MKTDITVYLELDCEIEFYEDTDDDRHYYPSDFRVASIKGAKEVDKWLEKEILSSNEESILDECDLVLQAVRDANVRKREAFIRGESWAQ